MNPKNKTPWSTRYHRARERRDPKYLTPSILAHEYIRRSCLYTEHLVHPCTATVKTTSLLRSRLSQTEHCPDFSAGARNNTTPQ